MRTTQYLATAEERAYENMREQQEIDYLTSAQYLLELTQTEPTVVHALRVLQSEILHGHIHVRIAGRTASLKFLHFVNKHWFRFCEQAIVAMMTYGFIPWYKRRLANGNEVPSVLPAGTFTWTIVAADQMKPELLRATDKNKMLVYDVKLHSDMSAVDRKNIFIYEYAPPTWNIGRTTLNNSVPSPLQNLVSTYRRLTIAMQNRQHADYWNSHAHIITSQSTQNATQEPTASMFEAGVQVDAVFSYEECQLQLKTRDDDIQNQFTKKVAHHVPYVYTLPTNVTLQTAPTLTPVGDVAFLQEKFKRDVALAFGIPLDVVGLNGTITSERSNLQTQQNDHLFHTNVARMRRHLQLAMQDAYREIYLRGRRDSKEANIAEEIDFTIVPASGLKLRNVEEIAKLASIEGAVPQGMLVNIVKELMYGDSASLRGQQLQFDNTMKVTQTNNSSGNADRLGMKRSSDADEERRTKLARK
jgi:hypothetical protein